MRYQRVSPDYLPFANGTGRKPSLRTCKEDEADNGRTPNYSSPFEAKSLRARSASGSGSVNPSATAAAEHLHFPHFSASPPDSLHSDSHAAAAPSASPAHKTPNGHHENNGVGGDVLLQWGHNKRSRGARAESRAAAAGAAGDESSAQSRQVIRIQRRAGAERLAAAAMPPPCGSYTRGANLRPCTPIRESSGPLLRSADERSGGASRSEKRGPPSPSEKAHKMAPAGSLPNGCGGGDASANPESKPPSDQETGGSGSGSGAPAATEKLNLEQFEWPRIYISLSRKEKEDDFLLMKGTKLPQRPKKRAKNIDKTLQYCFPGLWLSDLTRGRYEVREKKCVKKRRRGLKGMESMDSDSE